MALLQDTLAQRTRTSERIENVTKEVDLRKGYYSLGYLRVRPFKEREGGYK